MDRVKAIFELDEGGFWNARGTSRGHTAAITYGKSLRVTRSRFVEALGALWDDVERSEAAQLTIEHVISKKANTALTKALQARTQAQEAQRESQQHLRDAARALTETGMGMRDAGALLGLTQARVGQLLRD